MMGKKITGDARVSHDVSSSRGVMGAAASCCNSCSCAILVRLRRSMRGILGEIEGRIGGEKRACDAAEAERYYGSRQTRARRTDLNGSTTVCPTNDTAVCMFD